MQVSLMTITQIRYFLETANCGSFQQASEKLFISHQALNKQIKALESEIGSELFDRSGKKGLSLTEAGEIFFTAWNKVLPVHEAALSNIAARRTQKQNLLTVGIQDIRNLRYSCLEMFQLCTQSDPDIQFQYKIGAPDQILSLLDHNQVDMAILLTLSVDDIDRYPHLLLDDFHDKPVIAVSNSHPLSKRSTLSLEDLADETFILIDPSHSKVVAQRQQRDFAAHQLSPNVVTVSNPKELEIALALNQGISLIHEMPLTDIRDKVTVFPFEPAEGNDTYHSALLWNDKKHQYTARKILSAANALRQHQPVQQKGCAKF